MVVVSLTVLLQVLVLSAFGLAALAGQEAETERETRDLAGRVLLQNLVGELDRRIAKEEATIRIAVSGFQVETHRGYPRPVAALQAAVGPDRIFDAVFLIDRSGAWYDASGDLLWPVESAPEPTYGGDAVEPFARIEEELDPGRAGVEEILEVARTVSRQVESADDSGRPYGLFLLARLYREAGRERAAIKEYGTIVSLYPTAFDAYGIPLGPAAAAHRAELRTRQFRAGTDETTAAEVVADLIALRRVLLQNRFQLDDARTAWEMSRLRRLAEDARGDLALGAGVELQQALLDIDEQEKTLTALRSVFGPALHRVARGEAEGGRMRELLPNGPRAVYATRLADREFGAAVFEVDLVRLRTVLLPEILAALPLPEEVEATVLDSTGAPIVAGVVRPHGPVLAEDRLAEALPFWRAAVFLRDPSAAVRRTSSARRLHYGVMGVAIAGMLAAGWFVLRTVRSELKVAQMKSDFLSNITHELKTPLTSIRMFIETLQEGRVTDEAERNECLSVIAHESDRLSGLIQRVLDLSRFEGGKRPLSRETTDLGALVEDAAGIFRRRLGDSDVAFEVDIERDLPPVEIEPAPIQEVVLNLLSNALKYGSTRILLSARAVAGDAVLTVEDDGIGIAEDEQERIFEKFHRAEDTLARAVEGTGLGLALVREIVRAHGGRVGVTSTKGEGSRFTVRLPLGGN